MVHALANSLKILFEFDNNLQQQNKKGSEKISFHLQAQVMQEISYCADLL